MPVVPFGPYLPDLPALENPGATVASNVLPAANSYRPIADFAALSTALDARVRGAVALKDSSGNTYNYAGDATKLYSVTAIAVTDVSKSGGYSNGSDDDWEFAQDANNNRVIATNYANPVQSVTLGTSPFADLITSTDKPKAKHLVVHPKNFLVLGNLDDNIGVAPTGIRWSAQGTYTDFDESATTQSDREVLQGDSGWVQRLIAAGEYVLIFRERSITRMTYIGPPNVFQFDEVEQRRGCGLAHKSVTNVGRLVFFLSEDGFYAYDGVQSTPIGANKVDRTFLADLNSSFISRVSGAVDPLNKLVYWAYPSTASTDGACDKMMIYDYSSQRWSTATIATQLIFPSLSQGYTLEGLDAVSSSLDALPASLDSRAWTGGAIQLGVFDSANRLGTLTGANLAATVETAENQIFPGNRALLTEVMPIVDGGTLSMNVLYRDRLNDAYTTSGSSAQNAQGFCPFMINARNFRFRVSVAAGGTWTHALGVDRIVASDMGPN